MLLLPLGPEVEVVSIPVVDVNGPVDVDVSVNVVDSVHVVDLGPVVDLNNVFDSGNVVDPDVSPRTVVLNSRSRFPRLNEMVTVDSSEAHP